MALKNVPLILKHCTVAIFKGPHGPSGSTRKKFKESYAIARSRLTEYGFLAPGSEDGPSDNIRLTAKGQQREGFHKREGAWKNAVFNSFFEWIEVKEEEDENPPQQPPSGGKAGGNQAEIERIGRELAQLTSSKPQPKSKAKKATTKATGAAKAKQTRKTRKAKSARIPSAKKTRRR